MTSHKKLRELILFALLGAIQFTAHITLSAVPGFELVTLLTIVYVHVFGKKAVIPVLVYVFLNPIIYGFGIWWLSYIYVWPLLCLFFLVLPKNLPVINIAIFSAVYGLCFGALFALPYIFTVDITYAISYWISGLMHDVLHCICNFVAVMVLYKPFINTLRRLHCP